MSKTYITAGLRRTVRKRAFDCCEYCRIHEDDTVFGCEVDHIVAEKHGGKTHAENLALSCFYCNRNKGSDLGSISERTGNLTRLFHPRIDNWSDHFKVSPDDDVRIIGITDIGEVTVRLLNFNTEERLRERQLLLDEGNEG